MAGAAEQVLREPFTRFYAMQSLTVDGDVVRGTDTLGNARFTRTVVEGAQLHRSQQLVAEFGLADVDLSDESVGVDLGTEIFETLTVADLAEGLRAAVPPHFGG